MNALDVLYVDDDPDIRHIVALSLRLDPGVRARFAGSADEALAVLEDGPLPDVALVDVMMPGTDGVALAATLRDRPDTRSLPVIFVTARGREADLEVLRASGAAGVIVKPFDPLTLAATVRETLARAPRAAPAIGREARRHG